MALGLENLNQPPQRLRQSFPGFRSRQGAGGAPFGRGRPTQLLGQADIAGLFNPLGPPSSFFDPIRAEQTAGSQARQKQLLLTSQLFGRGDPSQRGFAAIQGMLGEQGNLARILGAARAQQQQQQLQFFQDLLKSHAASGFGGGFQ